MSSLFVKDRLRKPQQQPIKENGDSETIQPASNHLRGCVMLCHEPRNTGNEPLMLLCFFPVADISKRTQESGER